MARAAWLPKLMQESGSGLTCTEWASQFRHLIVPAAKASKSDSKLALRQNACTFSSKDIFNSIISFFCLMPAAAVSSMKCRRSAVNCYSVLYCVVLHCVVCVSTGWGCLPVTKPAPQSYAQ
jgi:hypothetical protein